MKKKYPVILSIFHSYYNPNFRWNNVGSKSLAFWSGSKIKPHPWPFSVTWEGIKPWSRFPWPDFAWIKRHQKYGCVYNKPLPRILVQVQMVDGFRSKTTFRNFEFLKKIFPTELEVFLSQCDHPAHLPASNWDISPPSHWKGAHEGSWKNWIEVWTNSWIQMVFIWIVSGEDMYPLITPWYVKSIFHRWKMMVKVEGACLQKFCRQFVAAEAYWLTVEKFRFQMSQKNDVNLAYRQRSGKTAEALEIAKSIPWSLEMMSLPVKDISALKKTFKTLFSPNWTLQWSPICGVSLWPELLSNGPNVSTALWWHLLLLSGGLTLHQNNHNHSYHALYSIVTDMFSSQSRNIIWLSIMIMHSQKKLTRQPEKNHAWKMIRFILVWQVYRCKRLVLDSVYILVYINMALGNCSALSLKADRRKKSTQILKWFGTPTGDKT